MSLVKKEFESTGNIQLINISNIAVGIVSTKIYYATSESGTEPPTFSTKELKIKGTDRILTFADTGANFKVLENSDGEKTLWVDYENKLVELNVISNDIINGIIGVGEGETKWSETIPLVNPGQFLWTKTVHTYNDGSVSVTYGLYHWGADAEVYTIECNCDEILKFKKADSEDGDSEDGDSEGGDSEDGDSKVEEVVVSPVTLNIKIRNQAAEENEIIYKKNLEIKVYSLGTGEEAYIIKKVQEEDDEETKKLRDYNDVYISQDLTDYYITVKLNQLVQKTLQDIREKVSVPKANKILIEDDCFVTIEYDHDLTYDGTTVKTYHLTQYLGVRYGMNSDMAKLSIKAEGINMAMENSQLVFDASGLTIQNGCLIIKDETGKDVLYADDGNLALRGNIYAEGGTIGGFAIKGNSLRAVPVDEEGKPIIDYEGSIELSGSNGKIFIGRSDNDSNRIIIDGPNGTISSGVYSENSTGWSISHDEAIFNNIVARGSIKAAVFEYGKVQAVGGILLVRPSTKITKLETTEKANEIRVTVEESTGFCVDDYCLIETKDKSNKLYFKVVDVPSIDLATGEPTSSIITLKAVKIDFGNFEESENSEKSENFEESENSKESENSEGSYNKITKEDLPLLIIDLGQKATDNTHGSVGIGINASENGSFVQKNSISVFELGKKGELQTRAILGLIDGVDTSINGTYGLYADNAFLRGSLVTESKKASENNPVYSGIGTNFSEDPDSDPPLSNVEFFPGSSSRILLWAGAAGTTKRDIEKANFYVDERGNVYGNSVYLKGSLITDSFIEAAQIKTAVIYGYSLKVNEEGEKEPAPAALSIRDASYGFSFEKVVDEKNKNYSTLYRIREDEVSTILPLRSKESIDSTSYLQIGSDTISNNIVHSIGCYEKGVLGTSIQFDETSISIKANGTNEKVKISGSMTEINGALRLGNMNYTPIFNEFGNQIGYDLFVGG